MGTVRLRYKFNLDFGSPPGELSYYLQISSNYIGRYVISGVFSGGLELNEANL